MRCVINGATCFSIDIDLNFQIEPVTETRLFYRKCVKEFPHWNQLLRENSTATDFIFDKVLALRLVTSAYMRLGDKSHFCTNTDCPTKLAKAAAHLATEVGISDGLFPAYVAELGSKPYYRLVIKETQLTLPKQAYLQGGALNQAFLAKFGE